MIPAGMILRVMGFLALFGVPGRLRLLHLAANRAVWEKYRQSLTGRLPFIEDQSGMGEFAYGRPNAFLGRKLLDGRKLSGRENACEVIATYNALLKLDPENHPGLPELFESFERRGISLGGYFGTSFGSVIAYLKRRGLTMRIFRGQKITPLCLEEGERDGMKVCIMMAENRAGYLKEMVHTICITKEEEGWQAHNDYEGSKIYPSLKDAVLGYHKGAGRALGVILL